MVCIVNLALWSNWHKQNYCVGWGAKLSLTHTHTHTHARAHAHAHAHTHTCSDFQPWTFSGILHATGWPWTFVCVCVRVLSNHERPLPLHKSMIGFFFYTHAYAICYRLAVLSQSWTSMVGLCSRLHSVFFLCVSMVEGAYQRAPHTHTHTHTFIYLRTWTLLFFLPVLYP